MDEYLTLEQLAEFTGEPEEALQDWQRRALIGGDPNGYTAKDVEKVRMIETCLRRGLSVDDVASVRGHFRLDAFVERRRDLWFRLAGTLADVAEGLAMSPEQARRLWEAAGLGDQGETVDTADAATLRESKIAIDAGFPEEGVLEIFRVLAETLGRAAEGLQRTTHVYEREVPLARGTTSEDVEARAQTMSPTIRRMHEPMALYFLRKAMIREWREDLAVHVAIETGKSTFSEVPGRIRRAVAFIDLSDFTPLTATKSDLEAAAVLRRFADVVRNQVMTAGGSVVKQIGDEFMLAFHDSASAVSCLSAIHRQAQTEPQFPAMRTGVHVGEMLYRGGDYVGTVVNTAARIRGVAGRHQIMVSGDVRREAGSVGGVSFVRVGRRALKGLPTELEVFEVTYSAGDEVGRVVDPVCGVELAATEVAARLTLDGVEREFCSDDCLRKFVVEPATFSGRGGT